MSYIILLFFDTLYIINCTVTVQSRRFFMFFDYDKLFTIGQFAKLHEINKKH